MHWTALNGPYAPVCGRVRMADGAFASDREPGGVVQRGTIETPIGECVHAAVNNAQCPGCEGPVDPVARQARGQQLPARHHTSLRLSDPGDDQI